jgi:hypothetical protein
MFMKNYYVLDYNDSFLKTQLDLPICNRGVWQTTKVNPNNVLCDRGLEYINKIGIKIFPTINLFVGPSNFKTEIHIDNLFQSYAINYVWGGSKSTMRWFDIVDNAIGESEITTANTGFIKYDSNQVCLIEEIEVPQNKLILVRIDIPHQVINYSNHTRYCLSLRAQPILSWDNIVTYFKSHIATC